MLFFFYPLWVILSTSFARTGLDLTSSSLWQNIGQTVRFTFWQAILSTGLTFLIGMPGAYLFSHYQFRGNQALRILISLPFILPTVVAAAGFNALIGQRGLLNLGLQSLFQLEKPPIVLLGTLGAILLAHVFYNTSIIIRLVGGAWSVLSRHPEQAARTLGREPLAGAFACHLAAPPSSDPLSAGAGLPVQFHQLRSCIVIGGSE